MNENSTQPETIGGQARAFEALAAMARTFPELSSAYTTVHQHGTKIDLQVDTGADFEAWRTALGIPSSDVDLTVYNKTSAWIGANGQWAGVTLHLTSHAVSVPQEPQPEDEPVVAELPETWHAAGAA